MSIDSLRCFICKLKGHLAKNCKSNTYIPYTQLDNSRAIETIRTESNLKNQEYLPNELLVD